MTHIRKFAFALAFSLPFALSLVGCPSDDGGNDDTGTPDGNFCLHQCSADADCMIGGMDLGFTCVDSSCTSDAAGCGSNDECVALFSGWAQPCTAGGGECDAFNQICVDVNGGLCATPPSDIIDCATLTLEEVMINDIDGNAVTVCGNPNAMCTADGACIDPCTSDADCTTDVAPVCNTGTGLCECGTDADCATAGAASPVCISGRCGCSEDQNCVDGMAGDVCFDGYCGCSGDEVCSSIPNGFDGGMITCKSL